MTTIPLSLSLSSLSSFPQLAESSIQRFDARASLPCQSGCLWKIETGLVRTLTWLEDGTIVVLGIWGTGDIVGKFQSKIEPYQIECLTKVEVTPFSVESLLSSPEVLLTHLQQSEELMVIRSYKRVDLMLLKLLSWLAKRFGQAVNQGCLIDLRLTHQDLSELLGSTRVTVTRTLNQLEQQGLIQRLSLQRIILQEEEFWHYEI
jgi:CRP-like cAMP-binding protein